MNLNNNNYSNPIDRSIIRINQAVPEILDRMLELYKAYAPKVLETLVQRFEENGGRLRAYKRELEKYTYSRSDFGIASFLDNIPFLTLVKIVEPSLHKVLVGKINEIASICKSNFGGRFWKTSYRVSGNNDEDFISDYIDRAVQDTEGFQKFVDFELSGIFPGRIPSYNSYHSYSDNKTGKIKDRNFDNRNSHTWMNLPVIGVYNKFNANLFNKLFLPEARILYDYNDTNSPTDIQLRSKHLSENYASHDAQIENQSVQYIHQNVMLIDVDTIFNTIAKFWRTIIVWNMEDTEAIDKETRKRIDKLFYDKALFPSFNHKEVDYSDIAMSCKSFALLSLNTTTSPEYKEFFREFDVLHNFADKKWGAIKNSIVASAITTYLANVCSRTQDFTNNMLDDIVNKYLSITAQDSELISSGEKNISTIRSKASDFYALFRNFLNTPSMSQRNMLNFDDISIKRNNPSSFHMSVKDFIIYLLKKIYEHECVTYNTVYNISNSDTNFCFMQTEAMMKKMLMYISCPEAKSIIESYKGLLGNKSLLGHVKYYLQNDNVQHPLAYLSRNHRALSSLYKHAFVSFINYIDLYRLKRNVSKYNIIKDASQDYLWKCRRNFVTSIEMINRLCSGKILSQDASNVAWRAIMNLNKFTTIPALVIGLFYDGKFNINYQMLNPTQNIILTDYANRIIDVISPKNLRRQHTGFSLRNRFILQGPICANDEEESVQNVVPDGEECDMPCDDCSDITYGGNVRLCDMDDLSYEEICERIGLNRYGNIAHGGLPTNIEVNKTAYTDFGQFDGELDSGLDSYESLNNKVSLKLTKTPSLEAVKKAAMKLNNLKIVKALDLATVAYGAQLACEKLDYDKLSEEEKSKATEDIKTIDIKLREVLNSRIYKQAEETMMNSMESIEFKDII